MNISPAKRSELRYPLLAALLARAGSFVFVDLNAFNWSSPKPDLLMEYGVIARNLINGAGYSYSWNIGADKAVTLPSAFMPPGQVFIDYLAILAFGNSIAAVIALFIINVMLGVASVYVIAMIAEEIFGKKEARTTAWLAALYPPFIYAAATFGITSSVIFISVLITLSAIRLSKKVSRGQPWMKYAVLGGASFGVLMFFRAETPLYLFAALLVLTWKHRRASISKIAVIIVTTLVVAAPWVVRNYQVFDRLILTSSNGGMNLWRGNNQVMADHTVASIADPVWSTDELSAKTISYLDSGAGFEKMYSTIFYSDAVEWIKANPLDAAVLSLKKGVLFWTFANYRKTLEAGLYWALYILTVIFFFSGLFRAARERRKTGREMKTDIFGIQFIGAWCISATVIAMIFFPQLRLQVITSAIYFPVAARGFTALGEKIFHR